MHCKTTCPLPVNNLLTCSFYGFYTVNVWFSEIQSNQKYEAFSPNYIWSDQCENVSLYLFIVGNADWGLLMDVVHNIFIHFYMTWWCFIFSILPPTRSSTVLLMYQLEKAVSYLLNLWCLFDLWALWSSLYFPGEGRRFLPAAFDCPTGTRGRPKDPPEASENSSSAEQTLDVLIYTVMFCTVKLARTRRLWRRRDPRSASIPPPSRLS